MRAVVIGHFTPSQHAIINTFRGSVGLPPLESPEIVMLGSHLYRSRVTRDGYTIEDVMLQIEGALADTAIVQPTSKMTTTRSATLRADGYGNDVRDEGVYELSQRKPRAELFSVVPKGDTIKPPQPKKPVE